MGCKQSSERGSELPPIELQIMAGTDKQRMVHHRLNFDVPRKEISIGYVQAGVEQVLAQNNLAEKFSSGFVLYADGKIHSDPNVFAAASRYMVLVKNPSNADADAGDNTVATISLTGKATLL